MHWVTLKDCNTIAVRKQNRIIMYFGHQEIEWKSNFLMLFMCYITKEV